MNKNDFRATTICFTSYPLKLDQDYDRGVDKCIAFVSKYADWYLYGHEKCPTTGRPHLQGMAYTKKKGVRWTDLFKSPAFHVEKCHHPEESINYCMKNGNFVEWGQRPKFDLGSRNGPLTVEEYMKMSYDDLIKLKPWAFNQAMKAIQMAEAMKPKEVKEWPEDGYRPWQKEVLEWLDDIPDRVITFLVDEVGGMGKTTFFGWIGQREDVQYMGLMKKDDALHQADTSGKVKTYVMDLARTEVEFLPYATLEKLKDGYWTCGKYQGKKCSVGKRRVIVCLNSFPKKEALSKDRYEVYTFTKDFKLSYVPYASIP